MHCVCHVCFLQRKKSPCEGMRWVDTEHAFVLLYVINNERKKRKIFLRGCNRGTKLATYRVRGEIQMFRTEYCICHRSSS